MIGIGRTTLLVLAATCALVGASAVFNAEIEGGATGPLGSMADAPSSRRDALVSTSPRWEEERDPRHVRRSVPPPNQALDHLQAELSRYLVDLQELGAGRSNSRASRKELLRQIGITRAAIRAVKSQSFIRIAAQMTHEERKAVAARVAKRRRRVGEHVYLRLPGELRGESLILLIPESEAIREAAAVPTEIRNDSIESRPGQARRPW